MNEGDVNMVCGKCKRADSVDAWVLGMGKDEYKCPHCGFAFRRVSGPPKVYPSGFIMPGKVTLQPI